MHNPFLLLALAAEGAADETPAASADPNVDMLVGGQAVIEGVMMRSRTGYAVAVRKADGSIASRHQRLAGPASRFPFLKWPVLRGSVVLVYSLILGIRALNFSAAIAMEEENAAKTEAGKANNPSSEKKTEPGNWAVAGSMLLAAVFGVGLFILLPLWLTHLVKAHVITSLGNFAFNAIDGVLRVVIFLAYIWGISLMEEIRRVFMYHGAEHKVVYNFEAREPLTVANAAAKSRLHPRCGTSFLLFVMMISILMFSFIPASSAFLVKFGARLVLIPLIAGLAYEIIRASARRLHVPFFRILITPGLWLQRVTTKEPTGEQISVALAALEQALAYDYPEPALQVA